MNKLWAEEGHLQKGQIVFAWTWVAAHTMKLLTHNLLQSPGTRHGYPLGIEAEKVETVETEFNPDFLVRMVEKLDYPGLVTTIATVCHRHRAASPRVHAARA